jgi:hypothetical protein
MFRQRGGFGPKSHPLFRPAWFGCQPDSIKRVYRLSYNLGFMNSARNILIGVFKIACWASDATSREMSRSHHLGARVASLLGCSSASLRNLALLNKRTCRSRFWRHRSRGIRALFPREGRFNALDARNPNLIDSSEEQIVLTDKGRRDPLNRPFPLQRLEAPYLPEPARIFSSTRIVALRSV